MPVPGDALHNRWLSIEGSALSDSPSALLARAHTFVREVIRQAWNQGTGFVVVVSGEPRQEEEPKYPLIFSWAILEEVVQLATNIENDPFRAAAREPLS
jgi:hypothetical protein